MSFATTTTQSRSHVRLSVTLSNAKLFSLQLENLRGMLPFGEHSGGKLTVIKAGPGFHEEKSYDIGPDGEFTEVKPVQMAHDARKLSLSPPPVLSYIVF